jgi:hypothetical protein
MASPEKRNPATGQGDEVNREISNQQNEPINYDTAAQLQMRRLRSRFGFALETAIAISSLAYAAGPR